jgi:hypothetical protein
MKLTEQDAKTMKMRYKKSIAFITIIANMLIWAISMASWKPAYDIAKAEAENGIVIQTEGLSGRQVHDIKSATQKEMNAYLWNNAFKLYSWIFVVESQLFNMTSRGWSDASVLSILCWSSLIFMSTVAIILASWMYFRMWKKLDEEKNNGKVKTEMADGYDEALPKRSALYIIGLVFPWALGVAIHHPAWLGLAGFALVCYCETMRFKSYGGIVFGNKVDGKVERPGKGWLAKKIASICDFGETPVFNRKNKKDDEWTESTFYEG